MIGYSSKDNLCENCKYYNWGDHECPYQYIREIEIVVECEDYADTESDSTPRYDSIDQNTVNSSIEELYRKVFSLDRK